MTNMTNNVRVKGLTPAQTWQCESAIRTLDPSDAVEGIQWGKTWFEGSRESVTVVLTCLRRMPAEIDEDPINNAGLMMKEDLSYEQVQMYAKRAKACVAEAARKVEAALSV